MKNITTNTKATESKASLTPAQFIEKLNKMTAHENLIKMDKVAIKNLLEVVEKNLDKQMKANDRKQLGAIATLLENTLNAPVQQLKKASKPVADKASVAEKAPLKKAPEKAPVKPVADKTSKPVASKPVDKAPVDTKPLAKKAPFKKAHDLKVNDILTFKEKTKKEIVEVKFQVIKVDANTNLVLAQNMNDFTDASVMIVEQDENLYNLFDSKNSWNTVAKKSK